MDTKGNTPVAPMLQILSVNVRVTAWVSLAIGLTFLFTAFDREPLLRENDAVIGLSSQMLLLFGTILSFCLAWFLFTGRDLTTQGLAILWISLNFLVYRIGLIWINAASPCPLVILTGWKLGIKPTVLDTCWKALMAYFAFEGVAIFIHARVERRRLKTAEWKQTFEAYKSK